MYPTYIPFIVGLALLLMLTFRVTKSVLSPAVLFAAVWLISLTALFLSGGMFYQISAKTLTIYLLGAVCFSSAAIVGQSFSRCYPDQNRPLGRRPRSYQSYRYRVFDICLLLLTFGVPFYWHYLLGKFGVSVGTLLLAQIRMQTIQMGGTAQAFSLLNNFPEIASFVAAALYYENDGTTARRWRFYWAFLLAAVYGSMEGSKMPVIVLLLGVFFVDAIKERKVHVVRGFAVLCLGVAVFTVGVTAINFAYTRAPVNTDTMYSALSVDENYWLGSLVAFSEIVPDPAVIESTQKVDRFFLQTADSLGAGYYVPNLNAAYTEISAGQNTNTYTIYFSYYKDYGWIGTIVLMFLVGTVAGYVYQEAKRGRPIFVLMYAMLATATVFTIASEKFLLGLNGYIKALIFFTFVYKILPLLQRRRALSIRRTGYA